MPEHAYFPTITTEPNNWREQAACYEHPTLKPDTWFSTSNFQISRAIEVCQTCPVREMCLEDALQDPAQDDWGVRGGIEEGHRRRMRKKTA